MIFSVVIFYCNSMSILVQQRKADFSHLFSNVRCYWYCSRLILLWMSIRSYTLKLKYLNVSLTYKLQLYFYRSSKNTIRIILLFYESFADRYLHCTIAFRAKRTEVVTELKGFREKCNPVIEVFSNDEEFMKLLQEHRSEL